MALEHHPNGLANENNPVSRVKGCSNDDSYSLPHLSFSCPRFAPRSRSLELHCVKLKVIGLDITESTIFSFFFFKSFN